MAMTAMADAFERAGLSLARIRFDAANYDLARLVLNREPDPQRAVMRWLGMVRMPEFVKEIDAYLTAVKEEMKPSGAGDDQPKAVQSDQSMRVAPAPDPTSSGDEDQTPNAQQSQMVAVPSPDPELAEGEDQRRSAPQSQRFGVPPSVTPAQERAQRKLTRLQSSFYLLTDATGTHVPVEEMAVRKIPGHMNWLAGRAVQHGTDFMVLRNIYQHAPQVADPFVTVGECMQKAEIRQWVRKGKEEAFYAAKHADATMARMAAEQLGHD